jgi:hypothetical protein
VQLHMSWACVELGSEEDFVFLRGRVSRRVRFVFFLAKFDMRYAQDLAHDAHSSAAQPSFLPSAWIYSK